jgi:hypothetical protein
MRTVLAPKYGRRLLAFCVAGAACGGQTLGDPVDDGGVPTSDATVDDVGAASSGSSGSPDGSMALDDAGIAPVSCGTGLCNQVPPDCTTSLSGVVYDPAGKNPVYNAIVFIPSDPAGKVPAFEPGARSCGSCDLSIGDYVAATTTDATGKFRLTGVPATTKVPFVVQIGKWRREVFLPKVTACTSATVPAEFSRLPRNQSEGSLPRMALVTGLSDQLGCLLVKIGVDAQEFTAPHAGGAVDVYQGPGGAALSTGTAGDCTSTPCPLWSDKASLESYDMALLGCEGGEHLETKPAAAIQAMHDWLGEGGKLLATHYHYVWFKDGPADFANAATWLGGSPATGAGSYGIDTSFVRGKEMHDWLVGVGAVTGYQIALTGVASSVSMVSQSAASRWIYDDAGSAKALSLKTPVGGVPVPPDASPETQRSYCGQAMFTDLHAGDPPQAGSTVPASCMAGALSPGEAALEYLFFDLSACVASYVQIPFSPPAPGL